MDSIQPSEIPQMSSGTSPERHSLLRKPTLLPAFEPFSSSPIARPSSSKRKFEEESPSKRKHDIRYYPTPVPTSSTGILPSSPSSRPTRPALQRTVSTVSQRAALTAMPSVDLPADGTIIRFGRSSNSSDYQLSVNRFISRVHIEASYQEPDATCIHGKVVVQCKGENGAKIHCGGKVSQLHKGSAFTSDNPSEEIMLDVQDARVMIVWPYVPRQTSFSLQSDPGWNIDDSPTRRGNSPLPDVFASSPPRILGSSLSPSPVERSHVSEVFENHDVIQVYEDADSGEDVAKSTEAVAQEPAQASRSDSKSTEGRHNSARSSELSFPPDDLSDRDEENDPIVHSFGPFGDNVLGRMASFSTNSPLTVSPQHQRHHQTFPARRPSAGILPPINESPIKNHVINQLAFSRLHSIPLSTIFGNLPAELKRSNMQTCQAGSTEENPQEEKSWNLSTPVLKTILDNIPCVGEIAREGKDAAGKPLENEFYYVPEMDTDQGRRDTVTGGLGKTGLRAVRKNHKQYYWKKPRF